MLLVWLTHTMAAARFMVSAEPWMWLCVFSSCVLYAIGYACTIVGCDVEYNAKFTITMGKNACVCEGVCVESCGGWMCRFGYKLVDLARTFVRVAEERQWPLPSWVADYVNGEVDIENDDDWATWHVA